MTLKERIEAFSRLEEKINEFITNPSEELLHKARAANHWFTEESILRALEGISFMLKEDKLKKWTSSYQLNPDVPKIVGIVMAGNIPVVGFHDLLSVLVSGHFAALKMSSQDSILPTLLIEWLQEIEPRFKKNIEIRERLNAIEAVIATGSDNTSRYFEYYFKGVPNIIRKNRTSIAVLDGKESETELKALGKDIFWYFGLGCRNVSKILVPQGYDHTAFFEANEEFKYLGDNYKYRNNYDYYKSIYLVNGTKHLDNGFLLWLPTDDLVSPISVLYVQEFERSEDVMAYIKENETKIQCMIGKGYFPFGQAQHPELWDYADNVDTLTFLDTLK